MQHNGFGYPVKDRYLLVMDLVSGYIMMQLELKKIFYYV